MKSYVYCWFPITMNRKWYYYRPLKKDRKQRSMDLKDKKIKRRHDTIEDKHVDDVSQRVQYSYLIRPPLSAAEKSHLLKWVLIQKMFSDASFALISRFPIF